MASASAVLPTVLIVDDYLDAIEMYATYLDLAGFRALKARDGLEALRFAASEAPDVILMDLSLPGIDGFEVTRRLKTDAKTSHIPVIALTANAPGKRSADLISDGFDGLIMKPCLPDALVDEIGRILERLHRRGVSTSSASSAVASSQH